MPIRIMLARGPCTVFPYGDRRAGNAKRQKPISAPAGTGGHLTLTCRAAASSGIWSSQEWFKRQGSCIELRHKPLSWDTVLQEPGVSSPGGQ